MTSSELALVEVSLTVGRRGDGDLLRLAEALLDEIDLVVLRHSIIVLAASYRSPGLRALDALHVASAQAAGPFDAFVSYDARQLRAAAATGLAVAAPGR